MIDLGCLNLRYLSDSGLYIRRFLIKFLLLLPPQTDAGVLPTAIMFCSATATVVA